MEDATDVDRVIHGQRKARDVDLALAELARRHGVVARRELIALGATPEGIDVRREAGRLHVLHRGVYAVGHRAVTRRGGWMAAVLAGGPEAVLSHHAAAALWRIRDPCPGPTDVTVRRQRRSNSSLRFHHVRLPRDEMTEVDGIPVSTMPRTLFDLATVLDERQLERAINEADYLRLTDPLSLRDLLVRYPRRAGAARIRAALAARSRGATRTRSDLEELFLSLLDRHGLPRPRVNSHIPGIGEVDCAWPAARLVVELDSRSAHATSAAFEADRERDRLLQAAGWRVIRITWRQLAQDETALVVDLSHLLGATVSA
ncbi:MAG TPA: type IV toxin-antitoxin system AbiEi family antitoxin domain-containing protein [Thermoleophilaceae bacterium]|nr:type IV toxin-antitoxin system AbiEi family antitoxin domain-containing protein [Thermoleophilaceae bacterium]